MIFIPWRMKNLFSRRFPLATHYLLNLSIDRKNESYWDAKLEQDWNDTSGDWPTKNRLIEQTCDPANSILDVGCGTGHLLRYLNSVGFKNLHAFDHSNYAITRLKSEGISGTIGKLPDIALPDETFDVVIASQVLEHIVRRKHFVEEIGRVLRPDGRFFVFVPNDTLDPLSEPSHVALYDRKSLRDFLSRHFQIRELGDMVDDHHPMPVLYAICEKRADTPSK